MTFDELKTFVRLQADADTTDAPDGNLLVYARMAYNDILSRRNSWPHLEVRYSLTVTPGTADYLFTTLSTTDMERVTSITAATNLGWRVQYITLTDAMLYYSPTSPAGNQALHYTVVGGNKIKFFPTPSAAQAYFVDGFRTEAAWPTTAGSLADLPRVFDEAIAWYMLAKYYTSQEDQAIAAFYMNEYEMLVNRWVRSETSKENAPRPSLMGGNNRRGRPAFLDRVRGSLE